MRRTAVAMVMVAILGALAAAVVAASGDPGTPDIRNASATNEDRTTTSSASTTEGRTTTVARTTEDRTAPAVTTARNGPTTAPAPGVDVSGPCDEAEHANDPRCTGLGEARGDSGGNRSRGHDSDDDSSGHRSRDDAFDDDSYGHGSRDDDFDDDSSGHGSGGGHSGHGGNSGSGGGHD